MNLVDTHRWLEYIGERFRTSNVYDGQYIFREKQSFPRPDTNQPYVTFDIITSVPKNGISKNLLQTVTAQNVTYEHTSDYETTLRVSVYNDLYGGLEFLECLYNQTYVDYTARRLLGFSTVLIDAGPIEDVPFLDDGKQWLSRYIRDFTFNEKITTSYTYENGKISKVVLEGDVNDHEGNTQISNRIVAP